MSQKRLLSRRQYVQGLGATAVLGLCSTESAAAVGGDEIWHFQTGDSVRSSPTVVNGTVYVGSNDNNVYALDADDGEEIWTFDTGDRVYSSPTVVDGIVYIGSDNGNVYALDDESAEEVWSFETTHHISYASPVVIDETVYVGNSSGMYALNAENGEEQWVNNTLSIESSATVVANTVYAGSSDGNVYALDASDGTRQWAFDTGALIDSSSPTVSDGTVYIGNRHGGDFYAIDAETGTMEWEFNTDGRIFSSPTVFEDVVFVGSDDDYLYAIDTDTGEQIWAYDTGERIYHSSPTVADNTVFIGNLTRTFYSIDANTGERNWSFDIGTISSPTVAEGVVYVGSGDNHVYALDAGVEGSSEGSRAMLGTLGHHHGWTGEDSSDINDNDPAHFEVEIVGTNAPVQAGDQLEVNAEIGNTGDEPETQTITFVVTGRNHTEETQISLAEGESTTETLSRSTDEDDVGELTVTVASEDDESTTIVEVRDPESDEETRETEGGESSDSDPTGETGNNEPTDSGGFGTTEMVAVGGGGGLVTLLGMYTLLRSSDSEEEKDTPATASHSPPLDSSPTSSTSTESSDQHPTATIDREINDIQTHLSKAREAQQANDYNSALQSCKTAIEIARNTQQIVEEHAPERGDEIEDLITEATQLQQTLDSEQETYEAASATLERIAANLDTVRDTLCDHPRDAQETLQKIETSLTEVAEQLAKAQFPELEQRLDQVKTRYESLQEQIQDARTDTLMPETIPATPRLSFTYDDIQKGDPLGSGGNADVYYATAETDGGEIELALKEPRMSGTLHTETVERMLDEAETWQQLDDHDHIVSVIDYGAKPLPWIAMEYMDAGHIGERGAEMSFDQQLWTAITTTKAVRHAHRRGVAHLDLKPENILFRSVEDAWDIPKVADWGLSKHLLEHSKSVEGMSPHYAAPEQFDKEFGPPDDITDVYQLGAVFYELFTGRPPFEGRPTQVMRAVMDEKPTPPSEIADVPPELDEILLTALATEKGDRYETVIYLRDELQGLR